MFAVAADLDQFLLESDYIERPPLQRRQRVNTHLVKRVYVVSTLERALSEGFFCASLTKSWKKSAVFSAATSLALNLAIPSESATSADDGPRSTIAGVLGLYKLLAVNFARSLKRLVPAVADIRVFIPSIDETQTNYKLLCNLLLSTLYQGGIKGVHVYTEQVTIPVLFDVHGLCGLTRISQGHNISCTPFAKLAYHNADTLQALDIDVGAEDDWRSLVYGGTHVPATFNSLAELILKFTDVLYETTWAAMDYVSPFPVLSTLMVDDCVYPFDDDLLFRGNGKTMKNLRIPFCVLAKNVLGGFDVFRRSGVSQMNSVRIGRVCTEDSVSIAEHGDAAIGQQVRHLLEASAALFISDNTSDMIMLATIETAPHTHFLRHLDTGGLLLHIAGVISVIAALPSLVSLACMVRDPNLAAGENAMNSLLSSPRKHFPLSKNFRVLRVPFTANFSAEHVARVAVHIAVLCPRFAFVDILPEHRKAFGREIAWAMVNKPFKPFANYISHLMLKG
ncbi:hypothetical protein GGI19_004910 [Coemansia pectinata]|uniref:Uncharacterized protein n=1 Tax=Coemansia pectinata TaxID=1052879 RepID=A0A9W8GQQ6_9FUNG|nr:hypothetical protein GGI19_004910 [Coemansia pectinata]